MSMNVGELKRELQARGISTESFLEKRELVKAYVEAVADGTPGEGAASAEEPYDSVDASALPDHIAKLKATNNRSTAQIATGGRRLIASGWVEERYHPEASGVSNPLSVATPGAI